MMDAFGISLLVAVTTSLRSPHMSIHVLHDTLQLVCDTNDALTDVIRFSKQSSVNFEPMVKVTRNKQCAVLTYSTTDTVQCECLQRNRVVCNISDSSRANRNGQWKCATLGNDGIQFSHVASASRETYSTIGATDLISASASTTSTHVNTSQDNETEAGTTPNNNIEDGFYGKLIIITTAGGALLLAASLLICVYRKCQKQTAALSPPIVVSSARITQQELLFEGETARQRSSSFHQDHQQIPMMDISPLADIFPLSNEEIIVEHTMESEAEQGIANHYETIPDSHYADVPVYQNESLESETHAFEMDHYENLLPKRPDEKTPYSYLGNI